LRPFGASLRMTHLGWETQRFARLCGLDTLRFARPNHACGMNGPPTLFRMTHLRRERLWLRERNAGIPRLPFDALRLLRVARNDTLKDQCSKRSVLMTVKDHSLDGGEWVGFFGDDDPGDEVGEGSDTGEADDERGDDAGDGEVPSILLREAGADAGD